MNADQSSLLENVQMLIDGCWVDGASQIDVLDKFHLKPCARLQVADGALVREAVIASRYAQMASTLSPYDRGLILDRAAAILERDIAELTRILQAEGGFPIPDAQNEIRRCVQTFKVSAEEARRFVGEVIPIEGAPQQQGRLGFTMRVPVGVVAAITPFNAPLNTVAHKVAPALAAGNSVVLKPSTATPSAAVAMAKALLEAGLPAGLITVVHGGAAVVQALLDQEHVRFYAFTGSTEVGRIIQERAGLRRTQMELGSIAFTILCADASLEVALPNVVAAAYRKAGQVCTSIQMLLVHRSRVAEVENKLTGLVSELRYGNPHDPQTAIGPVISLDSAKRIESWIGQAIESGAKRLVGGERQGALIPPTLLTNISDDTPVGCQEIFGPVMSIVPFDTLDEAIERVNATPYGLASGIFTNQLDAALAAARRLEVGGVHINGTSSSRVDLMPYGGSKDSGFGREGPHYAIREMSEERLITLSVCMESKNA